MNGKLGNLFFGVLVTLLVFVVLGCTPTTEQVEQTAEEAPAEQALNLATAKVNAALAKNSDRVLISGHNDTQYFVDAQKTSDGLQVVDTLLAAQTTCGVFVAEKAALELDISLEGAIGTALFDQNDQRVKVYLDLPGANEEQVIELANNFRQRCPIYTTLSEAESIEFVPGDQLASASVADGQSMVTAEITEFGKANVVVGDHSFVMDSVPPLDGPNIEINPLDMMLGGLAACSSFAHHAVLSDRDADITVEADFDPSGVRDLNGPNPRIRNIRILLDGQYEDSDFSQIESEIKSTCELFGMLNGTVNIEIGSGQTG